MIAIRLHASLPRRSLFLYIPNWLGLRDFFDAKPPRLKAADSAIAATALLTHTTPVTRNIRDFQQIDALQLLEIEPGEWRISWPGVSDPFLLTQEDRCRVALSKDILPAGFLQEIGPICRIDRNTRLNLTRSDMHKVYSYNRNLLMRAFLNDTSSFLKRKISLVSSRLSLVRGPLNVLVHRGGL